MVSSGLAMILSPEQLALVRARRKTRLTLPADRPCRLAPGRMYKARTVNAGWTGQELKDWRDYCQQEQPSRGRAVAAYLIPPIAAAAADPPPADVTILDIRTATLGTISQQDAQREGFRFLQHFRNHWENTYGPWRPEQQVRVVTFCVGDLRDLFDQTYWLSASPGVSGLDVEEHQDYTMRPGRRMRGEPPATYRTDLPRFAKEARERDELRKKRANAGRPRTDRIRELEDRAANGDQQAQRHLFVIDQRIEKADQRRARTAA